MRTLLRCQDAGDFGAFRRQLYEGSGTGYLANEMARRGPQLTAIDLLVKMVAHAVENEPWEPLGVRYDIGDAASDAVTREEQLLPPDRERTMHLACHVTDPASFWKRYFAQGTYGNPRFRAP